MIIVAGHITVAPENQAAAAAGFAACVTETRKEAGCIDYRCSPDADEAGRLNVFEQWEDHTAIDAHMQTPHLIALLTEVGPLLTGEPAIMRYDVAKISPLS